MCKKLVLIFVIIATVMPLSQAQDNEKMTVAILRYGTLGESRLVEHGILDMLQVYEWIDGGERWSLNERQGIEGGRINVIWGDANFDLPTANVMIENALDQGADILVTMSTLVSQIAVNITLDQEVPTPVLFTNVYNPYQAGIADSACIKPAHVSGAESIAPYEAALQAFLIQIPDLKRIGTIYTVTEATGLAGAEQIKKIGESLGLTVDITAITGLSDLRLATQGLVSGGAEAIVLPIDHIVGTGLPIIATVANANSIPMFMVSSGAVVYGATLSAGFFQYYAQGTSVGLMLSAWLNGDLDVANTAIDRRSSFALGINQDAAQELEMEIADELVERADLVIQDGTVTFSPRLLLQQFEGLGASDFLKQIVVFFSSSYELDAFLNVMRTGGALPEPIAGMLIEGRKAEDRIMADSAMLESLQCTEEMIAEQQAALDAAGD